MTVGTATADNVDPPDMSITWDLAVPLSDGGVLRANVYCPRGDRPVPVIVNMGPYGKDVPLSVHYPQVWAQLTTRCPEVLAESSGRYLVWEVPDPERWVPHGYALVHIDARGTGRSPGRWAPVSERETTDYAEAVEWLAAQPWCTGRVAVMGVSYHAMAAWRVAAQQPPHLAAVVPWYGAGDAYREAFRHGGILSNGFTDVWWHHTALNQHGSPEGRPSPFTGAPTTGSEVLDRADLERARTDLPAEARAHRLFDDWAAARAVDWSRVTVPFLSVAGLGTLGLHLRGNVEAFRHAASTDKWLAVLATEGSGIERFHDDAGVALQRRFLDHYLHDADNGWPDHPRVTYEVPGRGGATVGEAATWPPESVRWTSLQLDGDRRTMTAEAPAEQSCVQYWPSGGGVTFQGPAFDDRTEIVGPLALRLTLSTEAADVDVFASVRVLDAEGRPAGPGAARGWLRLSHRALDEEASAVGSPVHAHRRVEDVVPGRPYTVEVEMWPTCLAVPAGGALVLTVQGADPPDAGAFGHDDADDRPNAVFANWTTLHCGGTDEPARLLVPVLGRHVLEGPS